MKLNLGCGPIRYDGWLNVDKREWPNADPLGESFQWDLTTDFPWPEGSADYVFSGHFMSQLTADEGLAFLKRCYKVLKPQGVMRIADNDVMRILRPYFENIKGSIEFRPMDAVASQRRDLETDRRNGVKHYTQMHQLWYDLHRYNWKFLYDYHTLRVFLLMAGFVKVEPQRSRESSTACLRGLEKERHGEVIVEAIK